MNKFRSIYSPTLEGIKRKMQLTCAWPKEDPSVLYKIIGYFSVLALAFFCISAFIGTFRTFSNFGDLSYGVCCCLTALLFVLKQSILFWKKTKFFEILNILNSSIFNSHPKHYNAYLKRKIKICNIIFMLYLYGGIAVALLVGFVPVFYTSKRLIPVPFIVNMKHQPFIIYIVTWLLQALGTLLVAWNIPLIDSLICTLMVIAVAQLEILKDKISHATDYLSLKLNSCEEADEDRTDAEINNYLKKCVLHHIVIERYIAAIEDTFALSYLVQLMTGLIAICFIGLNCIAMPMYSFEFVRGFIYFWVMLIIMAISCIPGNEIILQSAKIRDACYLSQWNECGPTVRKTLLIIMERSKRPFQLTAAKFTPMSLQTFLAVLQTAFSYFTVLWQFYSANK